MPECPSARVPMAVFWKRAFAQVPNCPRVFFFFFGKEQVPECPRLFFGNEHLPECPTAQGCFSFFGKEQVPQCPGRPSARSLNPSPIISHYSFYCFPCLTVSNIINHCLDCPLLPWCRVVWTAGTFCICICILHFSFGGDDLGGGECWLMVNVAF